MNTSTTDTASTQRSDRPNHRPARADPAICYQRSPVFIMGDDAMQTVVNKINRLARRDCTVLLSGETGTGKELAARAIHAASARRDRPFVPVDCTALPAALVESQLFGHVRGAFTGAEHDGLGFLRAADGGTLFLDEIGELPPAGQAKLLRCIQERTVTPVGSFQPIPIDIRIIAATHRDLAAMVGRNEFREDLRYRLEVISIHLPPLRQRPGDIVPLAEHFLARLAERYDEPVRRLSAETLDVLLHYAWPGNVRQLSNAMEHAVVFGEGPILLPGDLPSQLTDPPPPGDAEPAPSIPTLHEVERQLIIRALQVTRGNQTHAARLIQIERHRLRRKILRHGLQQFLSRSQAFGA